MQPKATTPNIREVLESQGRKIGWVAEQLGLAYHVFTFNILDRGRVTPQERSKLIEVLGLNEGEMDAVLEETVRRPQLAPKAKGGAA